MMVPLQKPEQSQVDEMSQAQVPAWLQSIGWFIAKVGFPVFAAVLLLYVVFYGPHSTTAFAKEVEKITNANASALKDLGSTISVAVKEAVLTNAASTSATNAAVQHTNTIVQQLQSDISKMRDDTARTRETITSIRVDIEKLKK